MRVKWLIVSLLFISSFSFSKELSDFEKMLSGFPSCNFNGVFLDLNTLVPQHKYFTDRKMRPEKVEGYLAKFNVDEMYLGLHVSEIYIPADTLSVIAIVIDEDISKVERSLNHVLVNGYNKEFIEGDSKSIIVPTIERYKLDPKKTVMSCINPI